MGALLFLLRNPKLVLSVVVLVLIVSAWIMFRAQAAENARLESALDDARQMLAAAKAETRLRDEAIRIGAAFNQGNTNLAQALGVGREEIANADDVRTLVLAWAASDRRLCDAAGGCAGDRRA